MKRQEGQTLVLFALCLTVLMGIAALVVDVGLKYALERRYQSISDGAALAGAQELQPTGRAIPVTSAMQGKARAAALAAIANELVPGTSPSCADWSNCDLADGTYNVGILTPSPNCVDCVPDRAVQVTVTEPAHQTGFARLFGQDTWSLSRTSVAGLSFGKSYTIVALRPPASGRLPSVKDIALNGNNTVVSVLNGDVGSNANMQYDGMNARLILTTGYSMYYFDPANPPLWDVAGRGPAAKQIASLIADPNYPVPAAPVTTFSNVASAKDTTGCLALVATKLVSVPAYNALVPKSGASPDMTKINCYKPGTYTFKLADGNNELTVLEPGLYYFNSGLDIQSSIVGGFDPAVGGVSLVFPRTQLFKQRNGAVVLNAGTKFKNAGGVEPATAPAMTNTTPSVKMTVIVQKDPACPVTLPYPLCNDNQNTAITLAGGTALYLAGVQYAPSDNSTITGSSDGAGYVGQVWAWTLTYSGGTTINQEGLGTDGPGRIRIDTACSPSTPCNP